MTPELQIEKYSAQTRIENWPPYFMGGEVPELRVGSPDACVGVATLWTPVDRVWSGLDHNKVAVAGQLKTPGAGLSYLIRTCAANRAIRYLVICGKEMGGGVGGQALVNLVEKGVDGEGKIIGGPEGIEISSSIPLGQIESFREQIGLVDLRGVVRGGEIREVIDKLSHRPPYMESEAILLPLPQIEISKFPRRVGAEVVVAPTIGEAYVLVLGKVLRFGPSAMTNYGEEAEDVLNIVTVTDEVMGDPASWRVLPFTRAQIEEYIQRDFLTSDVSEGEWYTYGERIFAFGPKKINQFEVIVAKLLKDTNDRGAIAVLWDPTRDNQALRNPCLCAFQASIEQDRLYLTGIFRSNDMARAWPWNAFGLRRLQEMFLARLKEEKYSDLQMGSLITVSTRAHIYQSARETAEHLVEKHRRKIKENWDQRGNSSISLKEGEIIARLLPPDGSDKVLLEFRGKSAHQLAELIVRADAVGQVSHALDLGIHLAQAEVALKLNRPFFQEERFLEKIFDAV